MNSKIHKLINSFFRIFVPIIYILFILAGLISALVSGLIEYEVFSELYGKTSNVASSIFLSIPFLVVFCFEIVKIFLIFLNKQSDINTNGHYFNDKSHFLRLRYILIFISFFCTLIYSFYNLQNPEYDKLLTEREREIQTQYNLDLENLDKQYIKQIDIATNNVDRQIALYDSRMLTEEGFKFKNRQEFRGPRFEEAKKNKAIQEKRRDSIIASLNNLHTSDKNVLDNNLDSNIQNASNDISKSNISGNKMLKATLGTFKKDFPEHIYVLIVVIISLILSIGLEYIIWAAFTVLAMNHGEIFDYGILRDKYKNAADAEIDIEDVQNKADTKKAKGKADSILERVKTSARDIISNLRKDINN